VLPAAIVVTPAVAAGYAWIPLDFSVFKGVVALALLTAIAFALSFVPRDAGKRLEERLVSEWGGLPSTAVLRHRDTTFGCESKLRFHKRLVELGAVRRMPDKAEESNDPSASDTVYASACTWLRSKTRDAKKFSLLFDENIRYGFMRNLLGCKSCGGAVAALGILVDAVAFQQGRSVCIPVAISVATIIYLAFFVTPGALHRQAVTYACRLVEAVDALETGKKVTRASKASQKTISAYEFVSLLFEFDF